MVSAVSRVKPHATRRLRMRRSQEEGREVGFMEASNDSEVDTVFYGGSGKEPPSVLRR
jgi:hypothetical protein